MYVCNNSINRAKNANLKFGARYYKRIPTRRLHWLLENGEWLPEERKAIKAILNERLNAKERG